MFGRKHYCRGAENRIDPRCEHPNLLVAVLQREVDVSAFAAPHPIALALENFFRPGRFDLLDVFDKLFRIFSDAQEPLLEVSFLNCCSATPTHTTSGLLV